MFYWRITVAIIKDQGSWSLKPSPLRYLLTVYNVAAHTALPVDLHPGGGLSPGWEGHWITWLNEPGASLRKRCHLCCIVQGFCDSVEFRPILPFLIFLQTGWQLEFRKVHWIHCTSLVSFSLLLLCRLLFATVSLSWKSTFQSLSCEYWFSF
jgi:hypothetical protein